MPSIRSAACALAGYLFAATTVMAGDLNPPPGPIQATDRTPINAQAITIPFTISEPGSYVLTSDIVGVGTVDTIIIAASDVTLDLNGFTIRGVTGSNNGIEVALNVENVAIRNGTITGHNAGINASLSRNCRFENLRLAENGSGLFSGLNATVTACTAYLNQFTGISVGLGSAVENCTAQENGQFGFQCTVGPSTFRGCTATRNGDNGFSAITIEGAVYADCAAYQNGGDGFETGSNASISNCTAKENGDDGFRAASGSTIRSCVADGNGLATGGVGFRSGGAAVLIGCTATSNGAGFSAGFASRASQCVAQQNNGDGFNFAGNASFQGCTAEGNGGDGFEADGGASFIDCTAVTNELNGITASGSALVSRCNAYANSGVGITVSFASTVAESTASLNGNDGIQVANDCMVRNNNCDGNGIAAGITNGAGIRTLSGDCRIIGNNVTDNDIGIATAGGCFVVQNSAAGNTTNYSVPSGTTGPIITATGTITTTNPWANFSY